MKYSRAARLHTKAEFGRVFAQPAVSRDRFFKVLYRENGRAFARLGMAVSRRNCRHASGRNRLKRLIRESFRLHQPQLGENGGVDIVVMPGPQAAAMDNRALTASLAGHWAAIAGPERKQD